MKDLRGYYRSKHRSFKVTCLCVIMAVNSFYNNIYYAKDRTSQDIVRNDAALSEK